MTIFLILAATPCRPLCCLRKLRLGWAAVCHQQLIVQAPTIARLAEFIRATTGIDCISITGATSRLGDRFAAFPCAAADLGLRWTTAIWLAILRATVRYLGCSHRHSMESIAFPVRSRSMAADYITEIRRVQPHGPYFLAGHSFGGRVSFEMAQQLVREGERVSFLGLIDTTFRDTPVEGQCLWCPRQCTWAAKSALPTASKTYSSVDWDLLGGR